MAKAKKIIAIISLSLVGILILATLILSAIDVEQKITFNNPDFIHVYYGNVNYSKKTPSSIEKNGDTYNKILNFINGSSKEKALSALFNGTLFGHPDVVVDSASSLTTIPTTNSSESFFVYLGYDSVQTLKNGNENYKIDGKDYYYRGLCFEVTSSEGKIEVNAYVVPFYTISGAEYSYPATSNLQYQVRYVYSTEFSGLYNYLKELKLDK